MESSRLQSAVAVARALGHPARMRTLAMLRSGELCVCEVTKVLKLAASTVSLHLEEFKRCGLIVERKDGRWVYVRLADEPSAQRWVTTAMSAAEPDGLLQENARVVARLREIPVADLCRLGFEAAKTKHCAAAGA